MRQKPTGSALVLGAIVMLIAACGGDQSVASKSAAAYRDAKAKGVANGGGHDHGGHGTRPEAGDHSTMTGMDHSTMTGMDHSPTAATDRPMPGMDHSRMSSGGVASMDHSAMASDAASSRDHSAMQHGSARLGATPIQGMDHSAMPGMQHGSSASTSHATHSRRASSGATHGGLQHGTAQGGGTASHSAMQHTTSSSMPGMAHSTGAATQHGTAHSTQTPAAAGTAHGGMHPTQSSASAQKPAHDAHAASTAAPRQAAGEIRTGMTLQPDAYDTPAPVAVSEAAKAAQNIAEPDIRRIVPGTDSENPPTPAPPIRSGSGAAPAVGTDHSQHGATASPQPSAAPSPAVDHSQHGAKPAPAPRAKPRSTPPEPAAQTIYTCPMHPEVTSPKPGTCPKCGMALVKKNG